MRLLFVVCFQHPDIPEGELTLTNVTMLFLSSLLSTKVLLGNRLDWVDGMVFNVPVGGLRLRSRTSCWGRGDPCTVLLLMSVVTLASLLSLTPMPAPFHHEYTADADPPSQRREQQSDRLSSVDILHNGFCQKISLYHHTTVNDVVADKWVDARLRLLLLRPADHHSFLCTTGVVVVQVRIGRRAGGGQGKTGLYGDSVHQSAEIRHGGHPNVGFG